MTTRRKPRPDGGKRPSRIGTSTASQQSRTNKTLPPLPKCWAIRDRRRRWTPSAGRGAGSGGNGCSPWARSPRLSALASTAMTMLSRGDNSYLAGSSTTYTVKRGDLLITVTEDGSLESAENLDIKCEVAGGTTIVWIIEDGKKVTKGTELLRLDSSKLSEEVSAQEIDYGKAQADSIQSAKDYAAAKIAVEEYTEGTFKKDFRKAESDVAVAVENLHSAENTLQHGERMFRKGYITPHATRRPENRRRSRQARPGHR